eukprot:SAG31_NODE_41982_length_273_cov_1.183908_1_plen_39_part_10
MTGFNLTSPISLGAAVGVAEASSYDGLISNFGIWARTVD